MAAVKVVIPTPLRPYAGGNPAVEVAGGSVGAALAALLEQYPALKKQLYADDGRLRAFVNVYLNDEDIRYLEKEDTPVKAGDSLAIIPSIAGGNFSNTRRFDFLSFRARAFCGRGTPIATRN